jgi:hypothetical protein
MLEDFVQLDEAQQRRLIRAAVALVGRRDKGDLRRLDFDHVERVRRLAQFAKGPGKGIVEMPGCRAERRCEEGGREILLFVSTP